MFAVTILSVNTPPPPPPSRMARARLLSIIGRVINRRRLITFKVNTSAAYREGRWSVCENGVHIRRRQHKKKDEIETLTGIHLVNQQVSFVKLRDGASGKVGHQETGLLRSEGAGIQQLRKKSFCFSYLDRLLQRFLGLAHLLLQLLDRHFCKGRTEKKMKTNC